MADGFVIRPNDIAGIRRFDRDWIRKHIGDGKTPRSFLSDKRLTSAEKRWVVIRLIARTRPGRIKLAAWVASVAQDVQHYIADQDYARCAISLVSQWSAGNSVDKNDLHSAAVCLNDPFSDRVEEAAVDAVISAAMFCSACAELDEPTTSLSSFDYLLDRVSDRASFCLVNAEQAYRIDGSPNLHVANSVDNLCDILDGRAQ